MTEHNDTRLQQMQDWLREVLDIGEFRLEPASGDASFRRYFRLYQQDQSWIVMDAPPDKEDCRPFVEIAQALRNSGLHCPQVIQQDLQQGYLLLSDLGDQQYLQVLNADNVDRLYGDALSALASLQACAGEYYTFPDYSEQLLMNEMQLFIDWLIERHYAVPKSDIEQYGLDSVFQFLAHSALEQPQVPVHRDYHSRNLMLHQAHNPGVLDFQDAVNGPVSYDLVSLLKDCYISWPRAQVEAWVLGYHQLACQSGILQHEDEAQFLRWFDLMGVQRHLKAAGIFARLNYRDNKPAYLQDVPRTLGYITEVCHRYPELGQLGDLIRRYTEVS